MLKIEKIMCLPVRRDDLSEMFKRRFAYLLGPRLWSQAKVWDFGLNER